MKSTALAVFSYVLCLVSVARGDAPTSISGNTFDYYVTGANGSYPSSGYYRWFFDGSGNYSLLSLDSPSYTYGLYGYSKTSATEGTITNYDVASGPNFYSLLTYNTSSNGNFSYANSGFAGFQQGIFAMYSGDAPASIASNVFEMTVTTGGGPFRASGSYRIFVVNGTTYYIQQTNGTFGTAQSYTYGVTNRSTGMFVFNKLDNATSGFADLTYMSTTNGVFVMRDNSWLGYQSGTFTVTNFYKPTFVQQPVSQTAPVGTTITLSARANGTGPLTYQWYKNDVAIAGATATNYVIANAQVANNGSYRLVAQNIGGAVSSSTATLTLYTCSYNVSSNAAFFAFYGGNGAVSVTSTGSCPWTASTTNAWITLTSPTNRSGNGTITYSVAANSGSLPRTGALNVAGKTFVVAQGPEFAPATVSGSSFYLKITGGSNAPTNGTYVVAAGFGTNNIARVFPLTGSTGVTNAAYTYTKTAPKYGSLKFGAATTMLAFTNTIAGTFTLQNNGGTQTGQFTVIARGADFNADGRNDFAWQATNRTVTAWFMHGTGLLRSTPLAAGAPAAVGWKAIGTGDFNRDGSNDVLFQTTNGAMALWQMNGTNWGTNVFLRGGVSAGTGWAAIAAADFNGDTKPDILFQHTDGRVMLWTFNGLTFLNQIVLRNGASAGTGWRAAAATDLNGDRQTDILFQHSSGVAAVWLMNGTAFVNSVSVRQGSSPGTNWKLVGAGDINLDFKNDLLWQRPDGTLQGWFMSGVDYGTTVSMFSGQAKSLGLTCAAPK